MTNLTIKSSLSKYAVAMALGLSIGLSGCAVTTAGIKKGDERNFVRSLNDVNAARAIKARMMRAHDVKLGGVDVEVAEGIVLLSGNVRSQEARIEAERIAWSAPRVDEVGNEILIKQKQGVIRGTKDSILTSSVKTRLLADKAVKGRNFNVESHDGVVYLLGVARTPQELERAARIASLTSGTKEVVSYVRLADNAPTSSFTEPSYVQPQYAPAQPPAQSYAPSASPQPLVAPQNYQSYSPPAAAIPQVQAPQIQAPRAPTYTAPQYRALPEALSSTPSAPSGSSYYIDPATGARMPSPATPAPTAPAQIGDMGDQLGKAFPTDEQLGNYRSGGAGEAVSVIESAPYYVDPDTGKEIPVSYLKSAPK